MGRKAFLSLNRFVTKLLGSLQKFTTYSEEYANPWPTMSNITYTQQIQWRAGSVLK